MHRQNPYRYEIYKEEETRDLEELLRRYGIWKQGKFGAADIRYVIQQIKDKAAQLQNTVASMIILAHHSLKDLQAINDSVTVKEYVDVLMELEKKSQFANREIMYRRLKFQISSQQMKMCSTFDVQNTHRHHGSASGVQNAERYGTSNVQNTEPAIVSVSQILQQRATGYNSTSQNKSASGCTIA